MQTSKGHSDHLKADSLFRLIAGQLGCSMGVLTMHATHRDEFDILSTYRMPEAIASGISQSIQQAIWIDAWLPEKDNAHSIILGREVDNFTGLSGSITEFTFFCRVDSAFLLALTVCWNGDCTSEEGKRVPKATEEWVDSYLRLLWQVQRDRDRAAILGKALDLFDFAVMLLDSDGNMLFANEQANALLDAGEGLRRAGHSITATDFDNAVRLQAAIQYFNHCDEHPPLGEVGGVSVMLLQRSSGRPLVAALSPIPRDFNGSAATVLHVLDPDIETRSLVDELGRAFGLTATEASLAHHLVEGLTISEAARAMRIQAQTARAYLKQIFSKTNTHRQADLVRVILNSIVRIRATSPAPSNGGARSAHMGAKQAPVWG